MATSTVYITVLALCALATIHADARIAWKVAHATFYGDGTAGEARQGACGYDTFVQGYGTDTAALSTALFSDGFTCGACYQMRCFNSTRWCRPGTITITATNFCPPNLAIPSDSGGWCNPPREHFDLTLPAYLKIGVYRAGIVPVLYRRVPCIKQGGIKFLIRSDSNPYWIAVLVYNVAGVGDVKAVSVKGSRTDWIMMSRNWGQVWQTGVGLLGQSLSFRVTASDGRMVESLDVVPANWSFGQSFEGKQF